MAGRLSSGAGVGPEASDQQKSGRHGVESSADWRIALAITAALRVVYTAVAAAAAVLVRPEARLIESNAFHQSLPAPGGWHYALLGIWERFDTLWYLRVAERGYDLPAGVVFYPLYPWLIRGVGVVTGPPAAALLISTVAAFFCFWGMLRLAQSEVSSPPPLRTLVVTATWPASFFLFAGYTEALAIALIVWCVIWTRRGQWLPAAACAFAAGLTRSAGSLALIPLLIAVWQTRRSVRWPVMIAPFGTLGYWFWLHETRRLSVAAAYRIYWNTEVAAPWTTLWRALRSLAVRFDPLVAMSLLALAFFLVTGVAARRKMRSEDRWYSAAVIGHLLLRACTPPLLGAPRYLLPIYPAYLTMANWLETVSPKRFAFVCGALFAFNLAWMWAFLSWSFVL